jgi:hypothetical protein
MSRNCCASINDVSDHLGRKDAVVGFGDLGQIGRSDFQGFCAGAAAASIDAMTRHACDFIFNDPKMRVVGSRVNAGSKLEYQDDQRSRDEPPDERSH